MSRKAIFFSLDTIFAITIAVMMVLAINFFILRTQEDPVKDLHVEKAANDILLTMVKNGTFENTNTIQIGTAFSELLPENLGGVLKVNYYRCVGQGCTDFIKVGEYKVDKCRINVLDVVLVFDRSGSMDDDGGSPPQPITNAKNAASNFVDQLDDTNDRSSLVSFSSSATLNQALTYDKSAVKSSINSLNAGGFTAIGDGIQTATNHLVANGRVNTKWSQVLLSDGVNNMGTNPITAANNAKNAGIVIYSIGLGSGVSNATMSSIANITGGKYYYAPTSGDLDAIYNEIAKELLATEQEVSLARTSFLVFGNTTIDRFGTAELKLCIA